MLQAADAFARNRLAWAADGEVFSTANIALQSRLRTRHFLREADTAIRSSSRAKVIFGSR